MSTNSPLHGVRVVEVIAGLSEVGAGLATAIPGRMLRDLGAEVTRLVIGTSTLDRGVERGRPWHRGKVVEQLEPGDVAAQRARELAADADVVVLAGPEELIERAGIGSDDLRRDHPALVTARIRPSYDSRGPIPDHELLVQARTGLMTQLPGNRPGPIFCDLAVGSAGAGLAATVGALALLVERERSGAGGWVETSLYDGVPAILPMITGRVEHPSPTTTLLWIEQGPSAGLTFRCADGGWLQLWFGAKGAYEGFLAHVGDPPTERGYNAEMIDGTMEERTRRWTEMFAGRDRSHWLADLAGNDFRCEPILRPGEILVDDHVRETGMSIEVEDPERGTITVLGPVARVSDADPGGGGPNPAPATRPDDGPLLRGVRIVDLSAYLAGPVAPQILAELGADVVKVEPIGGDAHRNMEPLFAAGQRGKRAMAVDLKAPGADEVMSRLFAWGDVVHHNSRVGLAERLGYDEATVRRTNPDIVYSFASGFGATGPRATLPANDYLMQALSGIEGAMGGPGKPTFTSWGSVDVTGGWVSACGILAALHRRRRGGDGQSVDSTLLGAGTMLESGAFVAGDEVVGGPKVDAGQTGYGAAYRIFRCADDAWLAVVAPDAAAWRALVAATGADGLPDEPPVLRLDGFDPQPEEAPLESAFAARTAGEWVADLRAVGVPCEPVATPDRSGYVTALVDDPVNRETGRIVSYEWGERGRLDQYAFPARLGPVERPAAGRFLSRLGEHTDEVLTEIGLGADDRSRLTADGVVRGET